MPIDILAPAKINLTLHVTGQRHDGYHLLDTVVAFADIGDRVLLESAEIIDLNTAGPEARKLPAANENLVLKAAQRLKTWVDQNGFESAGAKITLEKNLPIASGVGGGSANAAATLRGLIDLWQLDISDEDLSTIALSLGADVPMCLNGHPLRAQGTGNEINNIDLPAFCMVLINPGISVSTPSVFTNLKSKTNSPLGRLPSSNEREDWLIWLKQQRNDLQSVTIEMVPEIQHCLNTLEDHGTLLNRMSGSGATCFGVFEDRNKAEEAAQSIADANPNWWVVHCTTVC